MAVRMIDGIQPGANAIAHLRVRADFALALLVLHHATLFVERLLRDSAQQVAHAIAFHP